ncbi:MAG: hypothetical protein F6J93_36385 [Oscillatoria sp. SIO1A7]|nr:hypothetical protein [Oscillatoria sp. SIO1A7]
MANDTESTNLDPTFNEQVEKLHRLTVWARWFAVGLAWATLAPVSLWAMRSQIQLLLDYFTWAALRYTLNIWQNTWPTLGVVVCVSMTVAVLVWQSRNILFGRSREEQQRLEQQVRRIRKQGPTHPMWKWVVGNE